MSKNVAFSSFQNTLQKTTVHIKVKLCPPPLPPASLVMRRKVSCKWQSGRLRKSSVSVVRPLPQPQMMNSEQRPPTTMAWDIIHRTCEYPLRVCAGEWAHHRSEERTGLPTQKIKLSREGGKNRKRHLKGETGNCRHPWRGLPSTISRTFWGPMSQHKDGDVHIKGAFLLSLMEGPIRCNKDDGGYHDWLLREGKKSKAHKVSRTSSQLNRAEILLWLSNMPRWPPTQPQPRQRSLQPHTDWGYSGPWD